MTRAEVWGKGIAAAAIAGASNGMITGLAAAGIDPGHFNLQSGLRATLAVAGASAVMSAALAVAAYLKQSPLPSEQMPLDGGGQPAGRE
jgi:ABC-type phosphate transport system substrate-binding protein